MALDSKLQQWQQDLIDMSRNNNLLYYRMEGKRRSGMELLFEKPEQIFLELRKEGKSVPLDESVVSSSADTDADLWEQRLTRLRAQVRDDLNNRGINTLYLAFGLLEWKDSPDSEEIIRSPLLLVPVTLNRAGALGTFSLQRLAGEDTDLNPTLRHKLKHDFEIELPEFVALEEEVIAANEADARQERAKQTGPTFEELLQALMRRIPPTWQCNVLKTVHIGRFSFQKLAMYQDLQRNFEQFLQHPMLQIITNDRRAEPTPQGAYLSDELDDKVAPAAMHEVLKADSSQQEAIVAAKAGMSFVLQGPPGTGKSQTIANIIAECLGLGRTVLFVSEKSAALEVVRKRLSEAELDDFCMDLHDSRQDRRRFIRGLQSALNPGDDLRASLDHEWNEQSLSLETARATLNTYARELHKPRFALGRSAFDAYARLAALHGTPDRSFDLVSVDAINRSKLDDMLSALKGLQLSATIFDAYERHPWREILAEDYTPTLQSEINAHFGRVSALLGAYDALHGTIARALGEESAPRTLAQARIAEERLALALQSPQPSIHWFEPGRPGQIRRRAQEAAAHAKVYWTHLELLRPRFTISLLTVNHQQVLNQLTDDPHVIMRTVRVAEGETPQDVVIRSDAVLEAQLTGVLEATSAVDLAATHLADSCLWPRPQTGAEMPRLANYIEALLGAAGAPLSWLDHEQFPDIRATLLDAMSHDARRAALRADLDAVYLPTYLDLDLKGIAERFRTRYQSVFRFIRLQYYQDAARLRSHMQPDMRRTAAQLETDLSRATHLLAEIAWEEEHRAEVTRMLGVLMLDDQIKWTTVKELLDATQRLLIFHPVRRPPDALVEMVVSRASSLDGIRAHQTVYLSALDAWRRAIADLGQSVDLQACVRSAQAVETAPLTQLAATLGHLLATVRTVAVAASEVSAHTRAQTQADAGELRWQDLCDGLSSAQTVVAEQTWFTTHAEDLQHDFGTLPLGEAKDWQHVNWGKALDDADWAARFMAVYPGHLLPDALKRLLSDQCTPEETVELSHLHASALATRARLEQALTQCSVTMPLAAFAADNAPFDGSPLRDVQARIDMLLSDIDSLNAFLTCKQRIRRCHDLGLDGLITEALRERLATEALPAIFERRFYSLWLTRVWQDALALARFRGEAHAEIIKRFQALDERHEILARHRLRARLLARRQRANVDPELRPTITELNRLIRLKRQRPIRRIIQQTSKALIQLKPCWMMSPLSISQFIDGGIQAFDLVIFDEASQVSPEDAICAIARGNQLIVVGDEKQLPPTRFFLTSLSDDGEDEDEAEESLDQMARVESILNECTALPQRSLLWHYRSQHESLIAFSNQHLYDGRLITFPSITSSDEIGVRFECVQDGVYDRGHTRTNQRESERVVDLIVVHVRRQDSRSLGVVALSKAQETAIRDALERRRKADPTLGAFDEALNEFDSSFFIKNLESVQGDERDVIILSVGYGRDKDGIFRYNLGPLTKPGGERRLNVAVTRARQQFILVSSVHASDFQSDPSSAGTRLLRDYIEYAEYGPASLTRQSARQDTHTGDPLDQIESPFELAVYNALTQRGLKLATQVGCSGYRIDLAVEDPAHAGGYIMGIECDGASYHSSKTARDRDRLRQQHLERMGWTIHRIWSSDWWRNPEGEVERILKRRNEIERLRSQAIPIADEPSSVVSPVIANDDEDDDADPADDEEQLDTEEAEQGEPVAVTSAAIATPAETPASHIPEDELVMTLKERNLDVVDYRTSGGTIWIIESEKSEPFMLRLARETGSVFEFVKGGHFATRYRPAWRIKRPTASAFIPQTPAAQVDAPMSEDTMLVMAQAYGCEALDKRSEGGTIWVIASRTAGPFLSRARSSGFVFVYRHGGGRATLHRPSWYLKR